MSSLDALVQLAIEAHASDLHIDPARKPVMRLRGDLQPVGQPFSAAELMSMARRYIPDGPRS
jgi:Tfp pilus assembly pilus retraction ATPase PilT